MMPGPSPSAGRTSPARAAAAVAGVALAFAGCRSVEPKPARHEAVDPATHTVSYQPPTTVSKPEPKQTRAEVAQQADQRASIHFDLARAHDSRGEDEAAVAEYAQAIAAAPGGKSGKAVRAAAERRTGAALDRLGRFAQAEAHYREALKLAPDDPKAWNDQGYSYYLQGRWADASSALSRAVTLAPDDARVRTNLGLAQAAAGDLDRAFETLSLAGGPAAAHANLGYVLAASGRVEEARAHYASAVRLSPDFGPARQALARLDRPAGSQVVATQPDPSVGRASAPAR